MTTVVLLGAVLLAADEDVSLKELGIALPRTIGELQYKGRQDYPGEGLGYSVIYANKMCSVSLFVYDRGLKDIPDGKGGKPVEDEMKAAADELALAEKKGAVRNLKPLEGELRLPKPVLAKFATAGYSFDIRGGGCRSYVLVTGCEGHFVKLRATQYVVDGKTNDAELHKLLETVAGNVELPAK